MSNRRIDWEAIKLRLAEAERNLGSSLVFDEARRRQLLRKRAEYLAARSSGLAPARETQSVMVFFLGKERYAIGLEHLRQVVSLDGLVPVPEAPFGMLGVMNLRGEIGTVWDLARLLELPEMDARTPGHAIVLKTDVEIGLRVDYVEGKTDVDSCNLIRSNETDGALPAQFLEGLTQDRIHVLDASAILANIHAENGEPDMSHDNGRRT